MWWRHKMATQLNDLHMHNMQVIISEDDGNYSVDVKYTGEDGKFEDGEYLAGYTDISSADDAEFLARAYIDGYKLSNRSK
jgi:hypothetical protein